MSDSTELPKVAVRLKLAREAADLSQPQLADRVGMSQQGIQSIEAGKVIRPKKLREIARAVGRSEEWLLGLDEGETAMETPSNASFPPQYQAFPQSRVPLLGQTSAGANGRFILNGQDASAVFCPPVLEGIRGAYAVLVYGESMEPKFEAGETVWLHPYLPVRRGDYVVAQILEDEDREEMGSYIKQFVSQSGTKLVLRQFNPGEGESELLEFSASKVFSVHKIVFHQLV